MARGQAIFNTRPISLTGVAGINDGVSEGGLVSGGIPSLTGTCGTCHNTPNVGDRTPLNIGIGDPNPSNAQVNMGGLDISYLPKITVCRLANRQPGNNCKTTSDLGQALVDGRFAHFGKITGPNPPWRLRPPAPHSGVTWVDGELWHGTWEGDESDLRRIDPRTVRSWSSSICRPESACQAWNPIAATNSFAAEALRGR